MTERRRERGQAAVLTVVFMIVLLGMAAAVLDVGSWYKEDRELQATMDAAALAGARRCPTTRPRPRRSPSSTRRRTAAGSTRP